MSSLASHLPARKIPKIGVELDFCPSTAGFKSWRAMAFSPQTSALYIPLNLNCEIATFGPGPSERSLGGGGVGPVRRRDYKHPKSGGSLGEFLAMDARSGKILWRHRTPSPSNTAALTTAGGLVFGGDWDRHVYAYEAATGKVLWQTRLPTRSGIHTYSPTGDVPRCLRMAGKLVDHDSTGLPRKFATQSAKSPCSRCQTVELTGHRERVFARLFQKTRPIGVCEKPRDFSVSDLCGRAVTMTSRYGLDGFTRGKAERGRTE